MRVCSTSYTLLIPAECSKLREEIEFVLECDRRIDVKS